MVGDRYHLVLRVASRHLLNCCPGPTDTPFATAFPTFRIIPVTQSLLPPTAPTSGLRCSDNARRFPASTPNRWMVPNTPHPLPPLNLPCPKPSTSGSSPICRAEKLAWIPAVRTPPGKEPLCKSKPNHWRVERAQSARENKAHQTPKS